MKFVFNFAYYHCDKNGHPLFSAPCHCDKRAAINIPRSLSLRAKRGNTIKKMAN